MDYRSKLVLGSIATALLTLALVQAPVFAKSAESGAKQRYIVILDDLPLAAYDGRVMPTPERNTNSTRLQATAIAHTGARRLDVRSTPSKQYLKYLDERFEHFKGEAALALGRKLQPTHRYTTATNGFAIEMSAAEVKAMRGMPRVKAVLIDETHQLETDSGPNWIGAGVIQSGSAGFGATGGEGVVVGVIDTGVNWNHASFADPGEGLPPESGSWDHVNPFGSQLGLCSDPEVLCNDKLVGVYDFVTDEASTTEEEENTKGKDNNGHGSHVASTAVGNPVNLTLSGVATQIAGVAPNASLVMYRVCYIAGEGGCQGSAILSAIDQAITDGVDALNYSIGTDAFNPWINGGVPMAFLNAWAAGIFVATSVGNDGPNGGTIGSPANAPWIMAVGAATHDRVFGNTIKNMTGGDTTPPGDLIGASFTAGIDNAPIVHASDFGNALCGTGVPESQPSCAGNTGASSPFAPNTFNGQIVVCDRGEYGRVEKSKNVMLAGAGGYILANTQATELTNPSTPISADTHCLPGTHIGAQDGDKLRHWLANGASQQTTGLTAATNHLASITSWGIVHAISVADILANFSGRGPAAIDVLKPDVFAPGSQILAASDQGIGNTAILQGTSMASPHITGAAALLLSIGANQTTAAISSVQGKQTPKMLATEHRDWTPAMLRSALSMTATPDLARDFDGSATTPHKLGHGRPRLGLAANAGLYLNETKNSFLAANPNQSGAPKNLNLPGLVDSACFISCNFQRRVTDLAGGASWSAVAEGFDAGAVVNISPQNFTLATGASQLLSIEIDLAQSEKIGEWVYGEVRLSADGLPDMVFTVAVFADGGTLPTQWLINSEQNSGWQEFALGGLTTMPDATYQSGGLVVPTHTVQDLSQDPTTSNPYDFGAGVMTVWHNVPADALWLHTETLQSTATDLDLFVGLDSNGNGIAEASEELCASTSPNELELCDLFSPVAGEYWVVVQNWAATNDPDEATLVSAVVGKNTLSRLTATGSGIVPAGESQNVRLSWDSVSVPPGTELIGAVGIGNRRESPNNIGIIPVKFTKSAVGAVETLVLMNGIKRSVLLAAQGTHDLAYIDIPPGTDSLTITATGGDTQQSDNLMVELYRMDHGDAFSVAPFAAAPDQSGNPLAAATGGSGEGPVVNVNGGTLTPGRWYLVLKNNGDTPATVEIKADITVSGNQVPLQGGLWQPSSREGIKQGYDYAKIGSNRGFLWYTYDKDGNATWYLAANAEPQGNVWVAELFRYTNDGLLQQATSVGFVSITTLAQEDAIFSFVLYGENGSDRMRPSSPPICPVIDNITRSQTGTYARAAAGVGGASVLLNAASQGHLHYIYDSSGNPRWILGADSTGGSPNAPSVIMEQFSGYCAVCAPKPLTNEPIGTLTRDFPDENNATWTLGYELKAPLNGLIARTDTVVKLTERANCQ